MKSNKKFVFENSPVNFCGLLLSQATSKAVKKEEIFFTLNNRYMDICFDDAKLNVCSESSNSNSQQVNNSQYKPVSSEASTNVAASSSSSLDYYNNYSFVNHQYSNNNSTECTYLSSLQSSQIGDNPQPQTFNFDHTDESDWSLVSKRIKEAQQETVERSWTDWPLPTTSATSTMSFLKSLVDEPNLLNETSDYELDSGNIDLFLSTTTPKQVTSAASSANQASELSPSNIPVSGAQVNTFSQKEIPTMPPVTSTMTPSPSPSPSESHQEPYYVMLPYFNGNNQTNHQLSMNYCYAYVNDDAKSANNCYQLYYPNVSEATSTSSGLVVTSQQQVTQISKPTTSRPSSEALNKGTESRKAYGTYTACGEKIRRPPNAFMIFAKERRREILYSNQRITNKEVSKQLGVEWRNLSEEARARYQRLSEELRQEHQLKYPGNHVCFLFLTGQCCL